jgi:dihydroorotase
VIVIKGGTVVDSTGSRVGDVAIENGVITEVAENIDVKGATVLDAGGCVVSPGLVDIHVHLREPGREDAETVETGTRAAALGGFTAVVAMPNTEPTIDDASVVHQVQQAAAGTSCDVAIAASLTLGLEGKTLSPMVELAGLGVRMFTDDGKGLQDNALMRRAMEYSTMLDVVIASHCEDNALSQGGHMHEGAVSAAVGIQGIPAEAESLMVHREIALAKKTGAQVHILHLSTKESVDLVRSAKAEGVNVTAEVTPHHFTLTDEEVRSFDPVFKVNPPIRSAEHRDAVRQAVRDGVIDAIATDHAPHAPHHKELPFDEAPCGMLGLETALGLALTELELPIEKVLAMMSWQPARIAKLEDHGLPVAVGNPANLTVIDPDTVWEVEPEKLASKSRNTPFAGRKLRGRVRHTLLRGEITVLNGEAQK